MWSRLALVFVALAALSLVPLMGLAQSQDQAAEAAKVQVSPAVVATPAAPAPVPQAGPVRYGDEFFTAARATIVAARTKAAGADASAYASPAGPLNLGSVNATPPETYVLGPGDKLVVRLSSPYTEPSETKLVVDSLGAVTVPQSGQRLVVRGQTMSQAEALFTSEIGRYLRKPTVRLVLEELRTFNVTVLGESFAPGSYTVPATFTLFNLVLATGGPSPRGTFRTIQLRRSNVGATFDLYRFLISGEADQDIQLQPGDVVYYPVASGDVTVTGEVNRPGVFELGRDETLASVLGYAGGIRPSGVSQNVSIDSVVPGAERRLLNVNVSERTPASNPRLLDGDKVRVFSIAPKLRNVVSIEGPVEQPRSYAFKKGLRVSDLVKLALGLKPEADTTVAEIRRLNGDQSQSLIRVNLSQALQGHSASDLEMMADDTLRVFDVNDTAWRGDRKVYLDGAVRSPGEFYRADNMTVGDLVRQGRGLQPNAFAEEAHLQRYLKDGSPGPMLKVNLMMAARGSSADDLVLQDRDRLRIYTQSERRATPDKFVTVSGAVQRPGDLPLSEGMTVRDALDVTGGPTLNAHTKEAFLQRSNPDGTLGPLLVVNLQAVLDGDATANVPLQSRDRLTVYTREQAKFRVAQTVTVFGAVQRPGVYPRGENMTIGQLVALAGGTLPEASGRIMVAKANVRLGANVEDLSILEAESKLLSDRDVVTVTADSDILAEPIQVIIRGAVKRPGAYFFTRRDHKVKDLIDMAGGLSPEAWLRGGQVARRPELTKSESQASQGPRLAEILRVVQLDEYKRALAVAEVERMVAVASAGKAESQFSISGLAGGTPSTSSSESTPVTTTFRASDLVTPARTTTPPLATGGGNLSVRLEEAYRNPRSSQNFVLLPGDIVTIPETPSTVQVEGPGVALPNTFIFEKGQRLKHYLQRAGGFTLDGDRDNILIIRPGGSIFRPRSTTPIELGDVIYVPTRVMTVHLKGRGDELDRVIKTVTNGAVVYSIFKNLLN